jgi:hypothetical protein
VKGEFTPMIYTSVSRSSSWNFKDIEGLMKSKNQTGRRNSIGKILRLKGKGIPSINGYVEMTISTCGMY